jgi:ankyrin repeat protein
MDINAQDQWGFTQLHFATIANNISMVQDLIAKGIDVNIKDNKGRTALDIAINMGYDDIAEAIRNPKTAAKGINSQDSYGFTQLHFAVVANNLDKVKELLEDPDIDVTLKDKEGRTALDLAKYLYYDDIADEIVKFNHSQRNKDIEK